MRELGIVLLFIIAIPVMWLGSAWVYEGWHTYTHRYRLTIEVETADGLKSAASVIEVSIREKANWVPQTGGVLPSVRGEAVFVDLGNGRHVIATLGFGPHGNEHKIEWLAMETLAPTHASAQARTHGGAWREVSSWTGQADLPPAYVPTLVTFADLNDPTTAQVLYATEIYETREGSGAPRRNARVAVDRFAETFGPDVRFKRAWIEIVSVGIWPLNLFGITGDPVTRGIEQKLPWWDKPLPWLQPLGGGVYVDTRTDPFKINKELLKRRL